MTSSTLHAIYGALPTQLVDLPAPTVQFSPLVPGSQVLEDCASESLASAVVLAPPSTLERRYLLAAMLQRLEKGAPFTALAPKDKGGRRIAGELRRFGCDVQEESRSHFRMCTTTRPVAIVEAEDALSGGGMRQHEALGLWTQPGIFSWDRVDAGTELLLEHLPALAGHGADLGCGLGILSRAALRAPQVKALTLVDIDRRAIEAAKRNVTDPRASFAWADIRHDALPAEPLDFVLMNPPFHDSGIEDRALGQQFINRAAGLLKSGGVCWLVANRHLPYEKLLSAEFSRTQLVAEENGFKIYKAEK